MTRRSTVQRLVLLAASTSVITGGVLLPTSAFAAAPATHGTATATVFDSSGSMAGWTPATDRQSGVTVQLPGKVRMERSEVNGYEARVYQATTDYGVIRFVVYDSNDSLRWDLEGNLQNALHNYNKDSGSSKDRLRSKDVEKGTMSGDRVTLDAALFTGDGLVGHTRFIDLGDQAIQISVMGTQDRQRSVDADYHRLLSHIQLPDSGQARSF